MAGGLLLHHAHGVDNRPITFYRHHRRPHAGFDKGRIGLQPLGHHLAGQDRICDKAHVGLAVRHEERTQLPLLHQLPRFSQAGILRHIPNVEGHVFGDLGAGEDLPTGLVLLGFGGSARLQFRDTGFQYPAALQEALAQAIHTRALRRLVRHIHQSSGLAHLCIFIGLQQLGGLPEKIGNHALCFQVELIQAARGRALAQERSEPGELLSQLLDAPIQRDP